MPTKPTSASKLELQDIVFSEELHKFLVGQRAIARVLLHCHPSAFIDLNDVPYRHKAACLRGKITFAAVHKNKSGRLMLAVIPRKSQYSDTVREMLEERNVRVVVGNLPEDCASIRHECEEAIKAGLTQSNLSVINEAENWVARRAKEATQFEDSHCLVFHEMAIDSVISLPLLPQGGSAERANSEAENKLERFYRNSSFDVLVTTQSPRVRPLLALEFDGPIHDTHDKQIKDEMKNDLCLRAGLPLIRVRYDDIPMNAQDEVEQLSNARKRAQYDEKIKFFVRRLSVDGIIRLYQDEAHTEHFRRMLKYYLSLEAEDKRAFGISELSEKHKERIWQRVFDEFGADDPGLEFQDWDKRRERDDADYESYMFRQINAIGATLSEISYYDNKAKGGIVASAEIQLVGEPPQKLTSPPIQLKAVGVAPNMLSRLAKEFAREWIFRRALANEKKKEGEG